MASILIDNLHAGYGNLAVLHGVSMRVAAGTTVALLGTNGNGKSTLLKAIVGLVPARQGSIALTVDGTEHRLDRLGTEAIVDLGVGMIPEGRRLFPNLSVAENLLLGAARPTARRVLARNLDYVYATFPILSERAGQMVGTMSGGQQQMVAIARALMTEPKLLLVDEPSVGLAPLMVRQTIEKLRELKENRHLTVLIAEQNFHETRRIADRAYVIAHGEMVLESDDMEALGEDAFIRNVYLGADHGHADDTGQPARHRTGQHAGGTGPDRRGPTLQSYARR